MTVCDAEDLNRLWSRTTMEEMHIKLVVEEN